MTIQRGLFALAMTAALGAAGTAQAGDSNGAAIFQGILNGIANGLANLQQGQVQQQQQLPFQAQGQESYARGDSSGGQTVGGAELQQVLAGNSVSGFLGDGTHFCEFYDFNGQVRGVDYEYYTGTWSVSGAWLHFDYPGQQFDRAYQVVADLGSLAVQYYDQNGSPTLRHAQFHGGNVCGA